MMSVMVQGQKVYVCVCVCMCGEREKAYSKCGTMPAAGESSGECENFRCTLLSTFVWV